MFKSVKSLTLILLVAGLAGCQNPKETEKAPAEPPNIGGLGITRGLVKNIPEATQGYVVFSPLLGSTTYLVNTDGEVVHTWESEYGPSGWVYLKDNGNLLRGGRDPKAPVFGGGGQGGYLQEFTWDGELVWNYHFATQDYLAHHDVAIMPNGNILAIGWEARSPEEAIKAGRKAEYIPKAGLWPDFVVELHPEGADNASIVWEWHIWDHLIQSHDSLGDNYGALSEHPELLDINAGGHEPNVPTAEELAELKATDNVATNATVDNSGSDLFHINAINYNAALDQIVLSSPNLGEVFIIDHSTTTEEAAGHSGGKSGKGGDFLYRWGNPENYARGDSTHTRLGGQHDVQWIPTGYPGGGNLMVFNNQVPNSKKPFSSVYEFKAPVQGNNYAITAGQAYGPEQLIWSYVDKDSIGGFSPFISGAHRMPNGNTFVAQGVKGRMSEVTPAGNIVWDYLTPFAGNVKMEDGTSPQPVGPFKYAIFRAIHIPLDHPAVVGKELTPLSPQPAPYKEEPKK
ncbi:aryl-sulfate sulfotransferase [uncultured Imperialibacter sp.]|uniref:aryl-sulfate sulfotransferase n=1 Tax=uncultured Imperialibacter sp. TaxID=1672639 RepID=UPI0030D73B8C|tara:strand:+ start:15878 stop:17416 length:1539 start_codon:yes stop_codon:yes gene_type:complete